MNDVVPDLTPPVKAAKEPKAKKEKVAKEPKPKKERGPTVTGYHKDAIIRLVPDADTKYTGQRASWFERVKAFDGKKVREFNEANKGIPNGKGTVQTPSGWLTFYVKDGSVKLESPAAEAVPAAA